MQQDRENENKTRDGSESKGEAKDDRTGSSSVLNPQSDPNAPLPIAFGMGDRIFALDSRSGEWKEGQVVGLKRGDKYDVCFDDGFEEQNIHIDNLNRFVQALPTSSEIIHKAEPKEEGSLS